ncbi:MAG: 2-amino-4-hydroxy-6-hydroxymethyldihydropteridine diphosphokinase, partial [Candidatus Nanopelagicales bacterium]
GARDPDRVLAGLQKIEHEFGRVRDVRWGPRTLDLDIIAVDDMISVDPDLTLPHPRAHERTFVLVPWHEIDPEATLPHHGPIENLINRLTHDAQDGSQIPSASPVVVVAGGDQAPGTST